MNAPLLLAQLRRQLGGPLEDGEADADPLALAQRLQRVAPERIAALLEEVARSYEEGDRQNARLHRALEISTHEAQDLAAELRGRQAQAESARRESEGLFQAIMELLPDIVSLLADDGTLIYNSPACTRIHGWSVADLDGMPTLELIHADDRAQVVAVLEQVLAAPGNVRTVQYRYRNKDGSYTWMEAVAGNQTANPLVHGIVAVSRDITERQVAEERLRQSEERYRNLADLLPIPVFEADHEGRLLFANEAFQRTFGRGPGAPVATLAELFAPDSRGRLGRHFAGIPGSAPPTDELTGLRGDGTPFPVELTTAVITAAGRATGLRGAVVDLTDRHRMQTEMVRAQKLETIGLLAGGIAHDFNNILTGIRGNVSLARSLAGDWAPIQDVLTETEAASQRAAELTRQLLTFARGGAPIRRPVAVERLCKEAASFVLRGSALRAVVEVAPGLPDVLGDEGQLGQALGNLLLNAREAMPNGGRLWVRAERWRPGEGHERLGAAALASDTESCVHIRVSDDGPGIAEDLLPRVFDPYVSTKAGGHGLGLASTYSIISRHGGHISVSSRVGAGTTFDLLLPAATQRAVDGPQQPATAAPAVRGRVLVMDDEVMICRLVSTALGRAGLDVDSCADGAAAIAAYQRAGSAGRPYDIVIMDLTIPGGMGGKEAAAAIRDHDPRALLVVSSGYSEDPVMADCRTYGFAAAVPKPYSAAELVAEVQRLLAPAA